MTQTRKLIIAHVLFLPAWALVSWLMSLINNEGGAWPFMIALILGWVGIGALSAQINRTQLYFVLAVAVFSTVMLLGGAGLFGRINMHLGLLAGTFFSPVIIIPALTLGNIITLVIMARRNQPLGEMTKEPVS